MDPEGAHWLTYSTIGLYGKPRLCINIHHYASPATMHRAAAGAVPCVVLRQQYTSEGSMSSFKWITRNEL